MTRVQLVPYNPEWPKLYESEAKLIQGAIKVVAIHHFGSTSVPGLCAKRHIDILIVVRDLATFDDALLVAIGYTARGEIIPTGRYFKKSGIHVHVFQEGSPLIERNLLFRDWLRTHPEDRAAYAQLKERLAPQFLEKNGMAYSNAKTAFIDSIVDKAKRSK